MRSKLASTSLEELGNETRARLNKDDFRASALGDATKLHYEPCAQTESEEQAQGTGEYMVLDNFGRKCLAPETLTHSLNERGNLYRDGYGWTSENGCNIDQDSSVRNARNLTNMKYINQLFTRPYLTVPYMGSGSGNGDTRLEDKIKPGLDTGSKRQCNVLAGVSIHPERMKHCMYINPQEVNHVIPDWRWGGEDTRMAMRRQDYKKRCGYKY